MDSPLLHEIGRLRELTFRAVGEGTGRRQDLDAWDSWYEHIVLWDRAAAKIAGLRIVSPRGAPVLAAHGLRGLYTASLFDYGEDALVRIAQGMELGRKLVVPEYWGGRSIDYLWRGIGAYLRAYPRVRYLFGAVSISAALPPAAPRADRGPLRALARRSAGRSGVAQPLHYEAAQPSDAPRWTPTPPSACSKASLDVLGMQVPMLYKFSTWIYVNAIGATMTEAEGVGLAAPQVGENVRLIVLNMGRGPLKLSIL